MQKESTTAKFSDIIEFRQAVYEHGLTRARDAQFELVDAALSGQHIQSFPELSLAPVFRRAWPSVYAAIEEGRQNRTWLEQQFVAQVPHEGPQNFPLDESAWVHSAAKMPADRQYIHGSTRAVKSSIVIGHSYSMLAWVPRAHASWALPLSTRRVSRQQTATDVGVTQVKQLCRQREKEMLVSAAQWELFLARDIVTDRPLPWQPAQDDLTPERTLQSIGMIFPALGSPAHAPQPRGKSPGWPKGRPRTRLKRHRVVKEHWKWAASSR